MPLQLILIYKAALPKAVWWSVRVDFSINLNEKRESDLVLAEYIKDIIGFIEQYQPAKIVFDELTPFLGFRDIKLLEETF